MSIECSLMRFVSRVRCDNELAFDDQEIKLRRLINIHVQIETCRNVNWFHRHWGKLHTPCGIMRPVVHIGKQLVVQGHISFTFYVDQKWSLVETWSLYGFALDLSQGWWLYCADKLAVYGYRDVFLGGWKASTCESYDFVTLNGSMSWSDTGEIWSYTAVK